MNSANKEVQIMISCDTGEVRKVTSEVVTSPTALMSQLLPVPPSVIPLSRKISFVCDTANKRGYGICALDSIKFNAHWVSEGPINPATKEKVIIPILSGTDGSESLGMMKLNWTNPIPEVMCPVFIVEFTLDDKFLCTGISKCTLAFVDKATGSFKAPPLPNVYEDGALCTGEMSFNGTGIIDSIPSVLAQWSSNEWNQDLIKDWKVRVMKEHFTFDAATGENIVNDEDGKWFKELPSCGSTPGASEAVKEAVVYESKRIIQSL